MRCLPFFLPWQSMKYMISMCFFMAFPYKRSITSSRPSCWFVYDCEGSASRGLLDDERQCCHPAAVQTQPHTARHPLSCLASKVLDHALDRCGGGEVRSQRDDFTSRSLFGGFVNSHEAYYFF